MDGLEQLIDFSGCAGYNNRTTRSLCGLRPVSHADFFMPACRRHYGRDDRPNKTPFGNKASRHNAVVESCPPSHRRAATKHCGGQ